MTADVSRCLARSETWQDKADRFQRESDDARASGDVDRARWTETLAHRARTDSARWKAIAAEYQNEAAA